MLTLLLPGLLLPAHGVAELINLVPPSLRTRLSEARVIAQSGASASINGAAHLDWIARELFHCTASLPSAPYAYAELSGIRLTDAKVWHAVPVAIEPSREGLHAHTLAPLADDEADELIDAANEILADAGAQLHRCGPCWFLRAPADWQIDQGPIVGGARAMQPPQDEHARRWARLHNALQMNWYAHPVNDRREERGEAPVGGVWLYGGGGWQPLAPIAYATVASADPAWRGAAVAASARGSTDIDMPVRNALLIWDDAWQPLIREDWEAWQQAAAAIDRRLTALERATPITLVLTGRATLRTLQSTRLDALKFWQRSEATSALAELS